MKAKFYQGLHQVVAHPLLFLTNNHPWAIWFHDMTAEKAWPVDSKI